MNSLVRVESDYENVYAKCPSCGFNCVYNRRSELDDVQPIPRKTVQCLAATCQAEFTIVGDSVSAAYQKLIRDTFELAERKRYMGCILNLAQAYEVFFATFLRVQLAYRPFAEDLDQGPVKMNECLELLYRATRNHGFARLRSLFLRRVLVSYPANLSESLGVIQSIPTRPKDPSDKLIERCSDEILRELLLKTKKSEIHVLRNRVVHSRAYRPSRAEVEEAHEEARSVLLPLGDKLDVIDDPNHYLY